MEKEKITIDIPFIDIDKEELLEDYKHAFKSLKM